MSRQTGPERWDVSEIGQIILKWLKEALKALQGKEGGKDVLAQHQVTPLEKPRFTKENVTQSTLSQQSYPQHSLPVAVGWFDEYREWMTEAETMVLKAINFELNAALFTENGDWVVCWIGSAPTSWISPCWQHLNVWKNEQQEVACLMLASMIPELQKNLENLAAFDMLRELKVMFEQQAEQELFDTVRSFHAYKQEEGQSVSSYVMKMKGYLDQMDRLGYPMPQILRVSLILTSLSKDYDQFLQNYNMHSM
ncbi:zinc finger, CCHC-type [Artemisia annua]|uniref:Zinc finger, CCHC-type n=1 Tax=Artemisia annua TaxID=35608 RepID=A0A2U1L289_ARTAN|nr:zinc finger, CCHC-type [Artemisia annua]